MQPWSLAFIEVTDAICFSLNFSADQPTAVAIDGLSHILNATHGFGAVIREDGGATLGRGHVLIEKGIGGVIAKKRIFDQDRAGVDAKAIDAAVKPEAHDILHCLAN